MNSNLDSLFGIPSTSAEVIEIPLRDLREFAGHPFQVLDDADMKTLTESVRQQGILTAVLVRQHADGRGYELISGHRRRRAAQLAGLTTLPAKVCAFDDDEATIAMVDANLQRTQLLHSERAFAYKMRLEAMERRTGRTRTGEQSQGRSDEALAAMLGESRTTVRRYIQLTHLHPSLLERVDTGKPGPSVGEILAALDMQYQELLVNYLDTGGKPPTKAQAEELKALAEQGSLTTDTIVKYLEQSPVSAKKLSIPMDRLYKFFPNHSEREMEDIIIELLEAWRQSQGDNERRRCEGVVD